MNRDQERKQWEQRLAYQAKQRANAEFQLASTKRSIGDAVRSYQETILKLREECEALRAELAELKAERSFLKEITKDLVTPPANGPELAAIWANWQLLEGAGERLANGSANESDRRLLNAFRQAKDWYDKETER